MELFAEILASLRANKTRTLLTGFAIAWGIFMLVALLACGNGLQNGVTSNFSYMNKNSVSLYPNTTCKPYKGHKRGRRIEIRLTDVEYLRHNIPNCTDFAPTFSLWSSTASNGNIETNVTITGVEPAYGKIRCLNTMAGRFINPIDERERRKTVIIPKDLCKKLYSSYDDAIGQYLTLAGGVKFKIVGVYSSKTNNYQELFIPFATANLIFNPRKIVHETSFTLVGIETKESTEQYSEQLQKMLSQYFDYAPDDRNAIWINNRMENFEQSKIIFNGIQLLIWVVGLGMLIAGIVGVGNILIVTVKERTREFGIRRAIGATPGSIVRLILAEALIITTMFGYIGMMFGIGLSELLCMIFPYDPLGASGPSGMFVNPTVDVSIVITATLILIIAGLIAGFIPALRSVKIKPIEAMNAK